MDQIGVRGIGRRRFLKACAGGTLAVVATAALGACGFRPLYGTDAQGGSVVDDLASVRVAPLSDRTGQMLHNFLRDRINPYGQPADPRYELRLALREVREETGIRRDETTTRAVLTILANFVLVDLADQSAALAGEARASSAFNILDNRYASSVSAGDAQERALAALADEVKLRLAAHFSAART